MTYLKKLMKEAKKATDRVNKIKLRQHLNADALFSTLRKGFDKIDDHRKGKVEISLPDALMSGFAVFSEKAPTQQEASPISVIFNKRFSIAAPACCLIYLSALLSYIK